MAPTNTGSEKWAQPARYFMVFDWSSAPAAKHIFSVGTKSDLLWKNFWGKRQEKRNTINKTKLMVGNRISLALSLSLSLTHT